MSGLMILAVSCTVCELSKLFIGQMFYCALFEGQVVNFQNKNCKTFEKLMKKMSTNDSLCFFGTKTDTAPLLGTPILVLIHISYLPRWVMKNNFLV